MVQKIPKVGTSADFDQSSSNLRSGRTKKEKCKHPIH